MSYRSHQYPPISLWWAESGPLKLDFDGRLYLSDPDAEDLRDLGPVEQAEVPEGNRPDLELLEDLWRDAVPVEALHREWAAAHRRQQGC
jgi:hypothetical protein